MGNFESVIERLKIQFEVANDKDVAEKIGISPTNLYERRKRESIPYEQIVETLRNTDVDLQWIFYGIESKTQKQKTAFIQYYSDISSSDGNGNVDLLGPYDMIQVDSEMFGDGIDIKNLIAVKINSTIMSPTIQSQSIVFIDRSKTALANGKAYLVQMKNSVYLSRLFSTSAGWVSRPDNRNYPEDIIPEENIRVIGKMGWKLEQIG